MEGEAPVYHATAPFVALEYVARNDEGSPTLAEILGEAPEWSWPQFGGEQVR
jgi:hypothetical protein